MGSNTGSWILLGLVAVVASLASAANIPRSDDQSIYQNNGNTFLSNGAGQIFRRADGRTVLIGSDGRQIITDDEDDSGDDDSSSGGNHNSNTLVIGKNTIIQNDRHNLIYGSSNGGSYISRNGRSIRVINGALELTENGQVYTFRPKANTVTEKETVTVNGQPAQVEYSNGDVIVELADHTVLAKLGDRTFLGDRNSFDNRDKLEADARNLSHNIQKEVQANLQKMREDLKNTFDHLFD